MMQKYKLEVKKQVVDEDVESRVRKVENHAADANRVEKVKNPEESAVELVDVAVKITDSILL